MTRTSLKNKIAKRLDEMDVEQLKTAYWVLSELGEQEKLAATPFDKSFADEKIERGLRQLDKGEGADFGIFLNEMKAKYGNAD